MTVPVPATREEAAMEYAARALNGVPEGHRLHQATVLRLIADGYAAGLRRAAEIARAEFPHVDGATGDQATATYTAAVIEAAILAECSEGSE